MGEAQDPSPEAMGSVVLHTDHTSQLAREMTLPGLIATGLCGMVGVGINIIPFMIQRSQQGIGAAVPLAYVVAAVPATLAALCYAILSSSMPRAGGSYVYATRAVSPFAGFLASFAQWFGLTMGMGVVAYLFVPMIRDIVATAGWPAFAPVFDRGIVRVPVALFAVWLFWWINIRGIRTFQRTVVALTLAMIAGPIIMTIVGAINTPEDFERALETSTLTAPLVPELPELSTGVFLGSCLLLFSSFIGFDSISQAGGEARNARDLPKSIVIVFGTVVAYYVVFTWSFYHAVPWEYVYSVSLVRDISAPALMAPLLPPWAGVVILVAVTFAILNSIPSVMLTGSRLLYAFSTDGVFPAWLGSVHPRSRTPVNAISLTAIAGSLSVFGCHLAGDFFRGVHLLLLSMLFNFLLMGVAVITLPWVNPEIYQRVSFLRSRSSQLAVGTAAILLLGLLLAVQVFIDLRTPVPFYVQSTTIWLVVMFAGSLLFARSWRRLRLRGVDPQRDVFSKLPPG